ncbi:uncharacterized protein LOC117263078 isoform X2 [Epinephelus lanceolatus]
MDDPAGNTKKEMPKRARNPPKKIRCYEPDPGSPRDDPDGQSTSAQHHPNTVDHSVIQPPTAWPVYQPPPTKSSPPTQPHHWPPPIQSSPPTKPQHRPVTAWPLYQLPVTQSLPHTHPYYQHPPIQPLHTNTHKNPAVLGDQSQVSRSKLENSSSSTADTIIIERDPIPDYGEPILRPPESTEDRSWKPCGACKAEVAKLMEEKDKLQDVLCVISGDHIKALKSFLDKVEQIQPQTGVWALKKTDVGSKSCIQKVASSSPLPAWLQSVRKQGRTAFAYSIFFSVNSLMQRSAKMLWRLGNTERCQMVRRCWISPKSLGF